MAWQGRARLMRLPPARPSTTLQLPTWARFYVQPLWRHLSASGTEQARHNVGQSCVSTLPHSASHLSCAHL
eukprot:365179-Chlamydomonas_euryale.AAC.6